MLEAVVREAPPLLLPVYRGIKGAYKREYIISETGNTQDTGVSHLGTTNPLYLRRPILFPDFSNSPS